MLSVSFSGVFLEILNTCWSVWLPLNVSRMLQSLIIIITVFPGAWCLRAHLGIYLIKAAHFLWFCCTDVISRVQMLLMCIGCVNLKLIKVSVKHKNIYGAILCLVWTEKSAGIIVFTESRDLKTLMCGNENIFYVVYDITWNSEFF